MCAHGCRLTGKMTGAGLRSVAWASVITLVESSVITLNTGNTNLGPAPLGACVLARAAAHLGPPPPPSSHRGRPRDAATAPGPAPRERPSHASSSSSWLAVSRESGSIALQAVAPKLRTLACIAGRTDAPLWDLDRTRPALLTPGMRVRFRAAGTP